MAPLLLLSVFGEIVRNNWTLERSLTRDCIKANFRKAAIFHIQDSYQPNHHINFTTHSPENRDIGAAFVNTNLITT